LRLVAPHVCLPACLPACLPYGWGGGGVGRRKEGREEGRVAGWMNKQEEVVKQFTQVIILVWFFSSVVRMNE
jgi:hypothetical protein